MFARCAFVAFALCCLASCEDDTTRELDLSYEGELGLPIPIEIRGNSPIVQVSINGGPERSFVVDTGASFFVVDDELPEVEESGRVDELQLGNLRFEELGVLRMDLGALDALEIHGLLGGPMLHAFVVALDYQNEDLYLFEDIRQALVTIDALPHHDGMSTYAPVDVDTGMIVASMEIEDRETELIVDTGASVNIVYESLYSDLDADRPSLSEVPAFNPLEGSFDMDLVRLCHIDLGEGEIDAAEAGYLTGVVRDGVLGLDVVPAFSEVKGLLGHPFLRQHLVIFDYHSSEMGFFRYHDLGHIPDNETVIAGFVVRVAPDGLVVVERVFPGTDAETKGILEGDVVLALDGVPVDDVDLAEPNGEPGQSIVVDLERDGEELSVEVLFEELLPSHCGG